MLMSDLLYWGLPSAALLINSLLFLILSLSKKDRQINSFMLFIAVMIFWAATSLLMKAQVPPGVLFYNRAMVASITMVPYFAFLFISIFTNQIKKIAIAFWSVVIFVIQIVNALGLAITSAEMVPVEINGIISYELVYTMGWVAYLCFGAVFLLLAYCMNLIRKGFKQGKRNSNSLRPVLYGLFILYIGMALNVIPEIGKYPFDFAFGIVTSAFLMYAIYKNRVVELRIVLTRALIFTILMTVIVALITLFVGNAMSYFGGINSGLSREVLTLLSTMISILLFQPLFMVIHRLVDRYFYQKENAQNNRIKQFTLTISNNLNLENITEELMKVVYEITGNDRIYIYLKNGGDDFTFYSAHKKLDRLSFVLNASHPFVRWFRQFDDIIQDEFLDNHPFFKTMWDKERNELMYMRFEAALPLKYHGNLIGILLMSSKDNTTSMSVDQLNMVSTLSAAASIAISNAHMFERVSKEAVMDSLTNVYNHRYFMDQLVKHTRNVRTQMVSLIMMNADMLGVFNDIYGHYAGDVALSKMASAIQFVCGSRGIVCRFASDSFGVILPYMDATAAYEMSEKIRVRIVSTSVAENGSDARYITVSCGISSAPSMALDDKDLLSKANTALRFAKLNGKNQSVIYSEEMNDFKMNGATDEMNMATIYALTAAIDAKDHYTFGHSQRVAKYAVAIATEAKASPDEIELIRQASLLHDIGKIGIPESILTKYTRLTDDEYETMKKHVDMSITIIKYLPAFSHVIPAVVGHHERWDGKGYPRRIKGENIPFSARCIAIADAFDAITSDRHYKTYLSVEYAVDEIERNAGTQFDPNLAAIFVQLLREGKMIIEPSRSNVSNTTSTAINQWKA